LWRIGVAYPGRGRYPEADGADRLPADPVARNEAYAHFRHKDFILCLGYRTDVVKNYFLNYNESVSNDFTL